MQKLDIKSESGVTLIELLISIGLTALISSFVMILISNVNSQTRSLRAKKLSKQESISFLNKVRRNFYVSIADESSPSLMHDFQYYEQGAAYGKEVNLTSANFGSSTLFTLATKCVPVPDEMKGRVPVIDRSYIANNLYDIECAQEHANLSCGVNETAVVELASTVSNRNYYLPHDVAVPSAWRSTTYSPIAAVVCSATRPGSGFLNVKIWTAVYRKGPAGPRLDWENFSMYLPPSSNGNTDYLP